ncbi:MAG: methyltransferase domain-containing protein, partial [Nanoarchaeota archaeon]
KKTLPCSVYTLDFVSRNLIGKTLEIGSGSGQNSKTFDIKEALEPCISRVSKNLEQNITLGFSENIPFMDKTFKSVLMLDTFDQLRSNMETLAEINRILVKRGRFIFDCQVSDEFDINYGLVFGFRNLRRYIEDFGFQVVEVRQDDITGLYCFEKEFDWTPKMLGKLQIVKENDIWVAKNFHPEEPFHSKYL